MHAVVIPVTFNDRSAAEAELGPLTAQISGIPDFVAGYWLAFSQEKGTALVVFESEESAQAVAAQAQSNPHPVVTAGSIEVGEVLAHA